MAKIEDFEDDLIAIFEEWNKAEYAVKLAEQAGDEVVFPAIKELRYGDSG